MYPSRGEPPTLVTGDHETFTTVLPAFTLKTGAAGGAIGIADARANGPVTPAIFWAATLTNIAEPFCKPVMITVVDEVELFAHVRLAARGVSQVDPSVEV
jgi:hypothetical protein